MVRCKVKNKLIAITGGIGSGKTSVSKVIKSLGYTVFSADEVYKELILDKKFVKKIYKVLDLKTTETTFNKDVVSKKVFENNLYLKKLNKLTHPVVMKTLINKSKKVKGLVFNEVPLLFESGYEGLYDNVIVVLKNLNERIELIKVRDNLTEVEIKSRINNQFNYENLNKDAYTIIDNNGDLESLSVKVRAVIEKFEKC